MRVETKAVIFCAGCGASSPEGARFCASCGRPFGDPLPAAVQGPKRGHRKRWLLVACGAGVLLLFIIGAANSTASDDRAAAAVSATADAGQRTALLRSEWASAVLEMNSANSAGSAVTDALAAQSISIFEAATRFGPIRTRTAAAAATIDALPDVPGLDARIFANLRSGADEYSDGINVVTDGLTLDNMSLITQGAVKIQDGARTWHAGVDALTAQD